MTDEEEFAARSQLKWTREGDAWILLYRRRRTGRVVPDKNHPGMWRSVKSSGRSDMANLCWSKDNVMAQAIREVAWDAANDPRKCPAKRGLKKQFRHPCVFLRRLSNGPNEPPLKPSNPNTPYLTATSSHGPTIGSHGSRRRITWSRPCQVPPARSRIVCYRRDAFDPIMRRGKPTEA